MAIRIKKEELISLMRTYYECEEHLAHTSEKAGLPRTTAQHRINVALEQGYNKEYIRRLDLEFEAPELPTDKMDVEDIIQHKISRFEVRRRAQLARDWMPFKMRIDGPFLLAYIGDPHMDDNGCNWPKLSHDVALIRDTEAAYGVTLGDYTNNWAGRLAIKKYPEQETTKTQAMQLAEWFFGQKKLNGQSMHWLLIKGNHDLWTEGQSMSDPLDWMEKGAAVLSDWEVKFRIVCTNKKEVPIWCSHNFKGSSMWNPVHGPMRKGKMNGMAAAYICGDKHNWACHEEEYEDRPGYVYWACRARGYKHMDEYAMRLGYGDQIYGATIAMVVDPEKEGPKMIRCFPDLDEAVEFLRFKRHSAGY